MRVFYGAGLNENQYPHPGEAASGSYNFDLQRDSSFLFPRKPFDLMGTADGTGAVMGMLQLIKRDETCTTLVQRGATVSKWDGGTVFSSVATVTSVSQLRDVYWSLGDYIVITDLQKQTPVSKWDGTTFSTLTTGLGTSLYAKYGIVHNGRVWLFNVKTSTDTPHLMVASEFENPESYDTAKRAVSGTFVTGSEAFYMLTPDLKPINGVALTISGDLVISSENGRLFKLEGSSATDYKWTNFYPNSNAVGTEAMVSAGNDVFYMRMGAIESLQATQNYGDVAADDISRWIPDTVANLSDGIAVYDQKNQKVLWFVTGKVLALYKDLLYGGCIVDEAGTKAKLSPWSIYTTSHDSNFTTSCARYMRRQGDTDFSVFFGDSSGRIFDLNGAGNGGDGGTTDITLNRKTRFLGEEAGLNYHRRIPKAKIRYQRTKQCSVSVSLDWGDEYSTSTASVTLEGSLVADTAAYFGGSFYFGDDIYFNVSQGEAGHKSHINTSFVGRGSVVTKTVSSTNKVRYHIDHIELK